MFEGHLDAEVAAGDHEAVEGGDDGVEVLDGLRLLDLGDDGDAAAFLVHDPVDFLDVPAAADEGEGDEVGSGAQSPAEVVDVLVGEGGDGDGGAGEVETLVIGDEAALDDAGVDAGAVDRGDEEGDAAVVDEDAVAGGEVVGEVRVGGAALVAVAFDGLGGDGEVVAAFEEYGAFAEAAEADLRALKVREDADGAVGLVGGLADVGVALLVFGVGAVAEVEAGHVHAGLGKGLDLVVRGGGGSQGADDSGSAHGSSVGLTGG